MGFRQQKAYEPGKVLSSEQTDINNIIIIQNTNLLNRRNYLDNESSQHLLNSIGRSKTKSD